MLFWLKKKHNWPGRPGDPIKTRNRALDRIEFKNYGLDNGDTSVLSLVTDLLTTYNYVT
jgi:hypothetical protein